MSSNMPISSSRHRLNPFIFPSDTDFRFILLILSVLGASLFAYHIPSNYLFRKEFYEVTLRCFTAANAVYPGNPSIDSPEGYQKQQLISNCQQSFNLRLSAWIAGGVGLMLVVAVILYWIAPAWNIWRDKLIPLSAEDAPEVVAYLEELCHEVGLHAPPTFMWNPLSPAKSGLAFGRIGHYYVALPGGLVTLYYADRPTFRAVILHELAHLKNADIDKTYFAVAVWQAFVVIAFIPFLCLTVYFIFTNPALDEPSLYLLNMIWRIVPLAALVYLMRNAVLRTREIYADVRASVWDRNSDALLKVLATLPSPGKVAMRIGLSVHPDPNERQQTLLETNRLFFRFGFWDAFATGLAVTIAVPNLILFLSLLIPFKQATMILIMPALLIAPLVIGILGVAVWRSSFAMLWGSKIPHNSGRLGVGLGVGLILGYALSFDTATSQSLVPKSSQLGFYVVLGLIALPVSLLCFLFLRWMAASASTWLESATTHRSLSLVSMPGYVVSGIVLAVSLSALFVLLELVPTSTRMGELFVPLIPWILRSCSLVLPLIIIYPVVAGFLHRQTSVDMQWAFLDAFPHPLTLHRQIHLHPGQATIMGLVSGVIFCGLLLSIRIVLRIAIPEDLRSTVGFLQGFFIATIALAVIMETGVAVIVAAWVRRLGLVHGLFAAIVAGCIITTGILSLNVLFGGTIDSVFVWSTFGEVIITGTLIALPFALAASAVSGWLRHFFA